MSEASAKLAQDRLQRRTIAKKARLESIPASTHLQPGVPQDDKKTTLQFHVILQEVRTLRALIVGISQRLDHFLPKEEQPSSVQRKDTDDTTDVSEVVEDGDESQTEGAE